MAEFNTATQFVGSLGGGLRIEAGYYADVTSATGVAAADLSATHSIPTTLTHVQAGWIYCSSASGGIEGCITSAGSVCYGHAGGGSIVDFTLDNSSAESDDYYIMIGW